MLSVLITIWFCLKMALFVLEIHSGVYRSKLLRSGFDVNTSVKRKKKRKEKKEGGRKKEK